MLLMTASAANAGGLVTKHASSVQLTVDAARSTSSRIGSSFSISEPNVDTTDGTTAGTVSAGTITSGVYSPGTIAATQDTAGAAFRLAQSYTQSPMRFQLVQQQLVLTLTLVVLLQLLLVQKIPWLELLPRQM